MKQSLFWSAIPQCFTMPKRDRFFVSIQHIFFSRSRVSALFGHIESPYSTDERRSAKKRQAALRSPTPLNWAPDQQYEHRAYNPANKPRTLIRTTIPTDRLTGVYVATNAPTTPGDRGENKSLRFIVPGVTSFRGQHRR